MSAVPYCRYVDTAAGQVHVAEVGRGAPLVLLPWFPLSGRLYESEFAAFAGAGWRVLAVDPLGFGRSGPKPPAFRIEQHADAIGTALTALGVPAPVVLAGHFGALVAVELANRAELGVRALALDGGPFVDPAAIGPIRAQLAGLPAPGWHADGSHRTVLYDRAVTTLSIFDPEFVVDAARLPLVHRFMADYLAAGLPVANDAPTDYPFAARLQSLEIPVAVLTAERDPLRTAYEPLLAHARRGAGYVYPGSHPLHDPSRAGEYARGAIDTLATLGVSAG